MTKEQGATNEDWWDAASTQERKGYLKSLRDQTDSYCQQMLGCKLIGLTTQQETKVIDGETQLNSLVRVVVLKDGKPFVDEIRWLPPKPSVERNGKLQKTRKRPA